jgi:hypothetical protein
MRQEEKLTGKQSVKLIEKAHSDGCKNINILLSNQHKLTVTIPCLHFLESQSAPLSSSMREWLWEIVLDTNSKVAKAHITHIYLKGTEWLPECKESVANDMLQMEQVLKDIKGGEEE